MEIEATSDDLGWFYKNYDNRDGICDSFVKEFFKIKSKPFQRILISIRRKNPRQRGWVKILVEEMNYITVNGVRKGGYRLLPLTFNWVLNNNLIRKDFWIKIEKA